MQSCKADQVHNLAQEMTILSSFLPWGTSGGVG